MQKYKNIIIENTPSEKFPELVTMTKTPKSKDIFLGRKYINITKAITAIDQHLAEELILKGGKRVKEELTELFGVEVEAALAEE